MRVLVTGGAGFIGSTLVDRLLAEGYDVDVVDDLSTGTLTNLGDARAQRSRRMTFQRLDVRSAAVGELLAHRKPEIVFHLAAQADVRVSVAKPALDAEVNVIGSLNVIQGALRAGTRKVVFAGSGGTLYGAPESVPTREGHPQLLRGERPTIYGEGEQTRDFVYVDDVVDAFVRAADKADGLLCNIGTGVQTSVQQLFDLMARATGFTEPARYAPSRTGELLHSALDPARAGIHLGWKPFSTLEDGIAQALESFRPGSRR